MKIEIVYRPTEEDILKDITRLKRKRKLSQNELTELKNLTDIFKAYEETGEIFFTKTFVIECDINEFRKILTRKRLRLLELIKSNDFYSISEITKKTKRNIKNIYEDLKLLEKFNLIKLEKKTKNIFVTSSVEEIILKI